MKSNLYSQIIFLLLWIDKKYKISIKCIFEHVSGALESGNKMKPDSFFFTVNNKEIVYYVFVSARMSRRRHTITLQSTIKQ